MVAPTSSLRSSSRHQEGTQPRRIESRFVETTVPHNDDDHDGGLIFDFYAYDERYQLQGRRRHRNLDNMTSQRSQRAAAAAGSSSRGARSFSNARQQPADAMMETLRNVQADSATTTAQRVHFQQLQRQYNELYRRARAEAETNLIETASRQQQQHQVSAQREQQEHAVREQQQSQPQPSTPQHRVYLIDCRSCGAFLTDRGMKAVLLLRPHITLYSTDAMPNCGPLFAPSRTADTMGNVREAPVERTCDCLTQTLACYGCGSAVGYHIVSPCARCTSSVAKHQRSSNGHRTVLHCSEIAVRERRYVPGEQGVLCAPPPPSASSRGCKRMRLGHADATASSSRNASSSPRPDVFQTDSTHGRSWTGAEHMGVRLPGSSTDEESDMFDDDDDFDDADFGDEDDNDEEMDDVAKESTMDADPFLSRGRSQSAAQASADRRHASQHQYHSSLRLDQPSSSVSSANNAAYHQRQRHAQFVESVRQSPNANPLLQNARHLKRGDVVFWTDLAPGGERCEPIDSDRVLSMPTAGR